MKPEIIRAANILNDNPALEIVLSDMKQDLCQQFMTCHEDDLIDLRRKVDAIDALRGAINVRVIDILETVNG